MRFGSGLAPTTVNGPPVVKTRVAPALAVVHNDMTLAAALACMGIVALPALIALGPRRRRAKRSSRTCPDLRSLVS